MAVSKYILVSLPLRGSTASSSSTWENLQRDISKIAFDIPTYKFHIPDLRVGTLDSLLALSDDLTKANSVVEGVTHKVKRQIDELERVAIADSSALAVDGVPIDSYVTRFSWDEAKYPTMTPLREVVDAIQDSVAKLEDDLKVRVAEYSNVKTQLSTILRKQNGSMAVRDLSDLVKADDVVNTEHLVTLLVVVSKYSQKDWLSHYETLSSFVVPRSSKKLSEDNEYALYTVTLFRKVADTFKTSAREKGFQVFSSWMHICAIRVFTESILRYGLPPQFLAAVLAPSAKNEKRVRTTLENLCDGRNSAFWKSDEDSGMMGLAGGDADVHPYVSITVNLSS
ncbi:hypothetical protein BDL97_05G132200 [Sphagnum fallax]|nr:hypothetical protein BDL97_05G132200 [Sphagnum fallax]KAH8963046.1 hypothetical protein BDL97_05G132200 [Sphagnum fallax]